MQMRKTSEVRDYFFPVFPLSQFEPSCLTEIKHISSNKYNYER